MFRKSFIHHYLCFLYHSDTTEGESLDTHVDTTYTNHVHSIRNNMHLLTGFKVTCVLSDPRTEIRLLIESNRLVRGFGKMHFARENSHYMFCINLSIFTLKQVSCVFYSPAIQISPSDPCIIEQMSVINKFRPKL